MDRATGPVIPAGMTATSTSPRQPETAGAAILHQMDLDAGMALAVAQQKIGQQIPDGLRRRADRSTPTSPAPLARRRAGVEQQPPAAQQVPASTSAARPTRANSRRPSSSSDLLRRR